LVDQEKKPKTNPIDKYVSSRFMNDSPARWL
jgi:hypothetical protein